MTRVRSALLAATAAAVLLGAAPAAAHPLGNFSINHITYVSVSADRIDLRYVLDQAEIPTFQERGRTAAEVLAAKRDEVIRDLTVTVDGRRVPLRALPGATISHPPGQGGLRLTRVELPLAAAAAHARRVAVHDGTFAGRVGWKAIVPRPGHGTAVRTTAERGDPTGGLRTYPRGALESPRDQRTATLAARPGDGTLAAPPGHGAGAAASGSDRSGDGFAGVLKDAVDGKGVLVFLLLAAFGWGALHALSPGHGKAMVAAYLVGTRGTARHAAALGAIVTITHTAGVFALGLVTLLLSQFVVPEQLYPWLTLASGLLVVVVGGTVLRSRVRAARHRREHAHEQGHDHHHDHHHDVSMKGLLAMGASAGLIPCPSALVVLLGAVSQHEVALGMLLIVAFSLGLAAAMTAIGVAVVYAGRLTSRLDFRGRVATALPVVSGVIIVGAGLVLSARAIPQVL
ncbi:MAG: nickel/cobalt transporter (NicO) family protein [Thermoleophilaceae bacterium]|nr:nickel/cobalt transporter (NicO) family protein [Thermoleophilaceae bacterium]